MSTAGDRDRTGSGERPFTTLMAVTADGQSVLDLGGLSRVQDGQQANAVVAKAQEAGAGFLVAVTGRSNSVDDAVSEAALEATSEILGRAEQATVPFGLAVVDTAGRSTVVAGVAALVEVGGFDPDEPGLGWVELADRLARSGFAMVGFDHRALPFVPALTGSLAKADRAHQEGRWFRRQATGLRGRLRFERHRRRVLTDVSRARAANKTGRTGGLDDLAEIETAARQRWRAPRPDEAQQGIGRRADWRHLIDHPSSPPAVAVLGLGPIEEWQWLADDGWAQSVAVDLAAVGGANAAPGVEPQVIVIGPWALRADPAVVERAAAIAGRAGSVVVIVDSAPRNRFRPRFRLRAGHRSVAKALRDVDGFAVRQFLALPDADSPKRYVPLDHPGGPTWLAGPRPALAQARLPRRRRLLRELVRRLAPIVPELLGGVVVVAAPSSANANHRTSPVVITSGFDEGSRTIVLPFGADGRPKSVVKVTARPAYRENAEREHRLLTELSATVGPAGLVPTPLERIDDGEIHAVVESYAGRWTMTDVLNEQPELSTQTELLNAALDAIGTLARHTPVLHTPADSTPADNIPADRTPADNIPADRTPAQNTLADQARSGDESWSHDGFDDLIGRWFDHLEQIEGPSPIRAAFHQSLVERSKLLEGRPLPIGVRHFDLGPWNMVLADASSRAEGRFGSGRSPITVVDWELAPPRTTASGPVGADHLYFTKYWLHIATNCRSVEDEQSAFSFLDNDRWPAHRAARDALARSVGQLGISTGFLPLLEAHVWAEAACYTSERRRGRGGDGGSPARYLNTLARHRVQLLDAWPVQPTG